MSYGVATSTAVVARTDAPEQVDGRLDVGALCRMFEEAEEASQDARQLAERDRDYYDNKQLTSQELAILAKRGQPPTIINRIKRKIDFLVGLEKQQRTMPRALPRTPVHEQDATAATDALRFVAESEGFAQVRSGVWRNMLVEGFGGACVAIEMPKGYQANLMGSTAMTQQQPKVKLRRYQWDRLFVDPHSSKLDFSDATYLGSVVWMDYADALAMYPDSAEELTETLNSVRLSDTYDDTPKWQAWADRKRRRVRIVQMWIQRANEWYFAEFTKGGILRAGASPYRDEEGNSLCELVLQSAYVDRENNRFGVVREMISPQDEINKRRSKSLHLLNTSQIIMEKGAVADGDIEKIRREAARPDGVMEVVPDLRFEFNTRTDLAAGHVELMKQAGDEIDMMGPNASMQGATGDTASGRAILASQQGGMIQMGDLLDNLRHFDERMFKAIWQRIRQFWTAPMWIRVTDDERNVRFVGFNGAIDPQTGRVAPPVAQMDVDIIIDDAPDSVTPAGEQWQAMVELKKVDANGELPFRALVEAMPNLRNKEKVLALMDEAKQGSAPPPEVQQMQLRGAAAEVAGAEAKAAKDSASARKTQAEAQQTEIETIAAINLMPAAGMGPPPGSPPAF